MALILWVGLGLFALGLILFLIGLAGYINYKNKVLIEPWWVYFLMIGGGLLLTIGIIVATFSYFEKPVVMSPSPVEAEEVTA